MTFSVDDADGILPSATSASDAKESTATPATSNILTQSAYLELREKLLASAPTKKQDKISCSPEIAEQMKREAIKKKKITRRESAAALNVYKPYGFKNR